MNILSQFPEGNKDEVRSGIKYYMPIIAFTTACLIAMALLVWKVSQIPEEIEELGEPIVYQPFEEIEEPVEEPEEITQEVIEEEPEVYVKMTDDDIIAAVVMSEAGNQEMVGKVAVAAVILNRCDYFDLSVEQVVSAKNQFSYPYYGKIDESAYKAVEIARKNRDLFDANMLYFRTKHYHEFGEPYVIIGSHYFSLAERKD